MTELSRILETSSFLSLCRNLRRPGESVFPGRHLRDLGGGEIRTLIKQGNIADNWSHVRVMDNFSPLRIYGNFFLGPCILGSFAERVHRVGNTDLPSGIFFSTLSNVIVGDEALVHRCALVSRYIIDAQAAVTASRLEGEACSSFGNGITIRAGIETGGRSVPVFYDLEPALAEEAARGRPAMREWEEFLAAYKKEAEMPSGYVGKKSGVHGTAVSACFIGPGVHIEGACRLRGSTLCAEDDAQLYVGSGCVLDEAVVRPGCRFDTQAVVSRSFFAEASGAERQAKVSESYIGPNTHIAEGEITCAFTGPFVSFHHQSLLIAAFWPGGRGNVGHGANVGSNHSSRAPDGELWPGEGMFFGLGCNIKYPADYSRSPYSVIAAGVTALPQKLEYPFSLITQQENPVPGIPLGYNRLLPAWVLKDNFYLLRRSMRKFGQRNRTPRIPLETDPLHAGNIALMREALERLERPAQKKEVYLPGDIPGIGKNILFEEDRAAAAETYAWCIRFACLRALCAGEKSPGAAGGGSPRGPSGEEAREYLDFLDKLYAMTISSRKKDEARGVRIIPDYAQNHLPAEEDEVVLEMKKHCEAEKSRLARFFAEGGL
jgi:carbonic anhydrase/acetyltransferase-like protein (isoleucine patch superfamily)